MGPWILALASDWSRGVCLRLLMWHCTWAGSPPLVWLPYGPFWPLGSAMSDWAFVPWIILASFVFLAQIHLHTFSDQHLWNSSNNHPMLPFISSDARLLHDSWWSKWVVSDRQHTECAGRPESSLISTIFGQWIPASTTHPKLVELIRIKQNMYGTWCKNSIYSREVDGQNVK